MRLPWVWDNSSFLIDGILRVASGVAGDFNRDGFVDAADYTVWRDSIGAVGAGLLADGNGDLQVDEFDYIVWSSSFSQGAAVTGSSVPEPASVVLVVAAIVLMLPKAHTKISQ